MDQEQAEWIADEVLNELQRVLKDEYQIRRTREALIRRLRTIWTVASKGER